MIELKRIAVFCASAIGADEVYSRQAYELGQTLAQQGIGLVYGGARVGLMGRVADGVLAQGGEAIGVLPEFLDSREVAHDKLTRLVFVKTMHERKYRMYELSDGVITLPGSYGTMDELFEMLTWGQLGLHHKPIGLLNTNGYYDSLLAFRQTMTHEGFLKESHRDMLLVGTHAPDLLEQMRNYRPSSSGKWFTKQGVVIK
ncbi:MAG: TIGR00730 family Rossman fold protein [Tannerellaceae bacterium]|jgi:uncharacterized protein (TIGR00730 family)|nr:TIGR00730 family Rossman fold protein [Tannerellaceae bacterium]